jgi:hypothetical protein
LLETAFGIAHARVAEPIVRCEHGQEVAVCAEHTEAEPELHRDPIDLQPLPGAMIGTSLSASLAVASVQAARASPLHEPHHPDLHGDEPPAALAPPPDDVPSSFWDEGADDETHQIALPSTPVAEPLHEPHYPHAHGDDAGGPNVTVPLVGQRISSQPGQVMPQSSLLV